MIDLPNNTKLGGSALLSRAYLDTVPDFFGGVVRTRKGAKIPVKSGSDQYSKIATIRVFGSDGGASTIFRILRLDNRGDRPMYYADVCVKVSMSGAVGAANSGVFVDITNARKIYIEQILPVIVSDDANGIVVELWFKQLYDNSVYYVQPIFSDHTFGSKARIEWVKKPTVVSATTAGTAVSVTGGGFETRTIRIGYAGSWYAQDLTYASVTNIVDPDSSVFLWGTPTFSGTGLQFPTTSVVRKPTSEIVSLCGDYINSTTLGHVPVLAGHGTTREVRWMNRSTGALITSADNQCVAIITVKYERV